MSTIVNLTSRAVALHIGRDRDGAWVATVVVKGTFSWAERSLTVTTPVPILEQDDLAWENGASSIVRAADLGPRKPRVDVILTGALVFPVPVDKLDVRLTVGRRVDKSVRIFGARTWTASAVGEIGPSRPIPTARVPIVWDRSYGGPLDDDPASVDPRNPVGCGRAPNTTAAAGRALPSFEDPNNPIVSPKTHPAPVGFGPLASYWEPRVRWAGTYDDGWRQGRWPLLPADFDPVFFNVAPADQQLDGYLPGEDVELTYMTAAGHDRFQLPDFDVPVTFKTDQDLVEEVTMVDTIVIEPEERRLSIVARAEARLEPNPLALRRITVGSSGAP